MEFLSSVAKARQLPRRVARMLRRWSLGPDANEQISRWQALADSGAALERIMASDAWPSIESCKRFYQQRAEQIVRTPSLPEDTRLRAAIELAVLDNFFKELRSRVIEGQHAAEALKRVSAAPTPTT